MPYDEFSSRFHVSNLEWVDKLRSFVGLLRVSKAVSQEASPIFCGKNTFRISTLAQDFNVAERLMVAKHVAVTTSSSPKTQDSDMLPSLSSEDVMPRSQRLPWLLLQRNRVLTWFSVYQARTSSQEIKGDHGLYSEESEY